MTPQRAARELLRRADAGAGLIAFTEYTFPRYRPAQFHRIVAGHLERIERGEIDRLMLLLPPRHGKSELASRRFPAFYLGRQPHKQFISVSATSDLATDFGRDVKNTIASQEYRNLFDTRLAEDSQAKGKWHTADGGIYYAVGVDGTVLGRGGDVVLIDDPFSTMNDALSEQVRKGVWQWFNGTIYNRLEPGAAIVVINHRMHEDDLSGRLLAQQAAGGDRWEVVELPALSETGEALWPEHYPVKALERIRNNYALSGFPRFWDALYQQRPSPETGDYWKAEWLRPYSAEMMPDVRTLSIYGGSDWAVTSKGGDYTVHLVIGVDPEGKLWLLDLWRGQEASDVWVERWCEMVKKWKPLGWAEEKGQIASGVGPFRDKVSHERQAYVAIEQFPTRGDKGRRAQSMRGRIAQLGLYVPAYQPWYAEFRSELMSFPAGAHDDSHDALGLVGQLLDVMIPGRKPKEPESKKVNGYSPKETTRAVDNYKVM